MINLDRLCRVINYDFTNKELLKQALSHRSAGKNNNERLEFLGDSILNMVIATALFNKFPEESEGNLSRLRAYLVKGETLASIALNIGLGDYLILGQGELKSGGFRRESILADSLEAIFAAIFLDSNIEQSQSTILNLFNDLLIDDLLANKIKDAKTQLQEYMQSKKLPLPIYNLTKVVGNEHEQKFYITCSIPSIDATAKGHGSTRRRAEQSAATKLLSMLQDLK